MAHSTTTSPAMRSAIAPTRAENFPEWYLQVIAAADLAEHAPVRGCMIIKPWGYAIWERMQQILDRRFKETGHVNAYFPLLIPLSFLEKEATHVAGFAKECAVVTHHRLIEQDGRLVPDGPLEAPLVIRPTSETIIGDCYARWIQSYRDLPMMMNQWANVMRWEMRTRLFLRTTEFLWQEGHTAHATEAEARQETAQMIAIYQEFAEQAMAMAVVRGEKTPDERFPGAVETWTIEAMMPDGKALQAGTSHFLGQNFAKGSGIQFMDPDGVRQYAWTTSWGVSTRLIGGLIMTHSDDNGLVLPPVIAPIHVRIVIVGKTDDPMREAVIAAAQKLKQEWQALHFREEPIRVDIDARPINGGDKVWEHIKKGIPVLIEWGPQDLAKGQCVVRQRHLPPRDKQYVPIDQVSHQLADWLETMQAHLLAQSRQRLIDQIVDIPTYAALQAQYPDTEDAPAGLQAPMAMGWARMPINRSVDTAPYLKPLKLTARCIPADSGVPTIPCAFTGEPADHWVLVGRAY